MKWTILPSGIAASGAARALRFRVFATPEVIGGSVNDPPVALQETAFHRWPERLRTLTFVLHSDGGAGTQTARPSNMGNLEVWQQLFGAVPVQPLPPATAGAAQGAAPASLNVFPATAANGALKSMHDETARLVFARSGLAPSASAGAAPVRPYVPTAADVQQALRQSAAPSTGVAAGAPPGDTFATAERFYVRPASQSGPRLGLSPRVADAADFHQWVARFTYHPPLLRELGLLLDFEVPWREDWQTGDDRRFWITAPGPFDAPLIKTRCRVNPAQNIFEARFERAAQYPDACLPLSQPEFSVVQVDLDGGVLKGSAFVRETAVMRADEVAVTPSLRSAGLSVIKSGRGADVGSATQQHDQLRESLRASGEVALDAEHLIRGVAIDVLDGGQWRPLCDRRCEFPWSKEPVHDSGWTNLSVTEQGGQQYLHESMFIWGGWSLVAPRPGKVVGQHGEPVQPSRLTGGSQVRVSVEPGSLPALRFGRSYRFRARLVDLAGQPFRSGASSAPATMTAGVSYQRFDPIASPLVIARTDLTTSPGQSVNHLVIRTGDDPESWRTAERHIAPPPVDVTLAEWHGLFDGATARSAQRTGGPDGASYDDVVRAARVAEASAGPGYYDGAADYDVRYAPDPLARGVTVFGLPHAPGPLPIPFGDAPGAFRLALGSGSNPPDWNRSTRLLTVFLQPAEQATIQIASRLDETDLGLLGMWEWLKVLPGHPSAGDAASGLVWALTPTRELTLTHAVQRPLARPIPSVQLVPRSAGSTFADLTGSIQFHAASTGHMELVGEWDDMVDRLDDPGPQAVADQHASALQTPVPDGSSSPLALALPNQPGVLARHEFGDTRTRTVRYHAVATSRFVDRFRFPDEATPIAPGRFTRSTPNGKEPDHEPDRRVTVVVPSTARPEAPRVRYVIPLYGWHDPTLTRDAAKTTTVARRLTGAALRVYLDRPWFSSGAQEQLAVILWPLAQQHLAAGHNELPSTLKPFISQWGMDPIWTSPALATTLGAANLPGRVNASSDPARFTVEELEAGGQPYPADSLMQVALFDPTYDPTRRLWYCDIAFAGVDTYRPFVRLALARFQRDAISVRNAANAVVRDLNLSRVVLSDFCQLANDRSASVSFARHEKSLNVSLSGISFTASAARAGSAVVRAWLERRTDHEPDGWVPVTGQIVTLSRAPGDAEPGTWEGQLPLGTVHPHHGHHRVMFCEYETLPSDSSPAEERLVYADCLEI